MSVHFSGDSPARVYAIPVVADHRWPLQQTKGGGWRGVPSG